MTAREFIYEPAGPVLAAFHRSRAFFRGIMGPVGSGKTTANVVEMLRLSQLQEPSPDGVRRTRWLVIRNTEPQLKSTTIKTFQEVVPPALCKWSFDSPITCRLQTADLDAEFVFLALDVEGDVRKLLSLEATGAFFNEARELPRSALDIATTRVGRFPSAREGGCTWSGIIADTNPPDTEHWWHQLAEHDRPSGWEFFRQPSGLDEAAENLANLNQSRDTLKLAPDDPVRRAKGREYYSRIAAGKSEDWLRVYVAGEYGFSFDGKAVFPEYADTSHVAADELDPLPGVPVHIGLDFGLTPAAVFLQRDAHGRWLAMHELVAEDMGMESFARVLSQEVVENFPDCEVKLWCDPAGMQRSQVDERTPITLLRGMGLPAKAAPTNDALLRIEAVRRVLTRFVDGKPGFIVCPALTTLRKALAGGYHYRRMRVSGSERFHDVPDKNEFSHIADALQYGLLGAGENPRAMRREQSAPRATSPYTWDVDTYGGR